MEIASDLNSTNQKAPEKQMDLSLVSQESQPGSGTSSEPEEEYDEREGFDNGIEFVLTCLGFAVGLGNVLRFPTRAYENGGSAFLIPYLTCAIFFGFPVVYLELLAGQSAGVSPPICFRRIMPVLEGVGWMSVLIASCVSMYYVVIISWISLYIVNVFRGHLDIWNKCDNEWNDRSTCIDMLAQKLCRNGDEAMGFLNSSNISSPLKMVYINGSCQDADAFENVTLSSATEQYFTNYIVRPSKGLFDINEMNYPIFIAMFVCWILTALLILKGVKIMGKISYATVILPYLIIFILFIRGITLEGASEGLYFYLGKPDFSKLFTIKTWTEALKQLCFSLSVGLGALMSLASYSKKRHNCFKDTLIILVGDTVMSLIGGTAVFTTLGFLAHQRGVSVPEVVSGGFSLSFVVYPEALTQMPISWLWAFLFFLMLFLLGLSSEMAVVEVFCTRLYDRYPGLRKRSTIVVLIWCSVLFILGIIFSTNAGFYWLTMFDEYSTGFSSVVAAIFEILALIYIYKASNFREDIVEMLGEPRNAVTGAIGPLSPFFVWNWRIISPLIGLVLVALSFVRDYPYEGKPDVYPLFFDIFGWFIAILPVLMIPAFAVFNYFQFRKNGYPLKALFSIQKQHPSYARIVGGMSETKQKELKAILPDREPWTVSKSGREDREQDPLLAKDSKIESLEVSKLENPIRQLQLEDGSDFPTVRL